MNSADNEPIKEILNSFRVQDLNELLRRYRAPHGGRKSEMVARAMDLYMRQKSGGAQRLASFRNVLEELSRERYQPYQQQQQPRSNNYSSSTSTQSYNSSSSNNSNTQIQANQYQSYQANQMSTIRQTQGNSAGGGATNMPTRIGQQPEKNPELEKNYDHFSLSRLRIVSLPFYDEMRSIVPLTEVTQGIDSRQRYGSSGTRFLEKRYDFHLNSEAYNFLRSYRSDGPTPKYELQLRFFLLDNDTPQKDNYPPDCVVKINNQNIILPNVIPTNKPGAEAKRPSVPVNVTGSFLLYEGRRNVLGINWRTDKRRWAFNVNLVKHLNSDILLKRLQGKVVKPAQETKKIIKKRMNLDNDDDDIATGTFKLALLCPMMRTMMRYPCNSIDCTHTQCFDALNYLMMNEKKSKWLCPICSKSAHYDRLQLDGYFMEVLQKLKNQTDITEIEVDNEGGWQPVHDESSDDEAGIKVKPKPQVKATSSQPAASTSSTANNLVVKIKTGAEPSKNAEKTKAPPAAPATAVAAPESPEIITLSDSDDDEARPSRSRTNAAGTSRSRPDSASEIPNQTELVPSHTSPENSSTVSPMPNGAGGGGSSPSCVIVLDSPVSQTDRVGPEDRTTQMNRNTTNGDSGTRTSGAQAVEVSLDEEVCRRTFEQQQEQQRAAHSPPAKRTRSDYIADRRPPPAHTNRDTNMNPRVRVTNGVFRHGAGLSTATVTNSQNTPATTTTTAPAPTQPPKRHQISIFKPPSEVQQHQQHSHEHHQSSSTTDTLATSLAYQRILGENYAAQNAVLQAALAAGINPSYYSQPSTSIHQTTSFGGGGGHLYGSGISSLFGGGLASRGTLSGRYHTATNYESDLGGRAAAAAASAYRNPPAPGEADEYNNQLTRAVDETINQDFRSFLSAMGVKSASLMDSGPYRDPKH